MNFFIFLLFSFFSVAYSMGDVDLKEILEDGWMFGLPDRVIQMDKKLCLCDLGVSNKILGGKEVEKNSIPWIVSLADLANRHYCGGTIINHNFILTSAECVKDKDLNNIKVRVGLHRLDDKDLDKKTFYVGQIFRNLTSRHNIAILKLLSPIPLSVDGFRPACLDFDRKQYRDKVMIAGWGANQTSKKYFTNEIFHGPPSPFLKEAYFDVRTRNCSRHLICIDSENGESACGGDEGGPLHYTFYGKTCVEGVGSSIYFEDIPFEPVHFGCLGKSFYSRLSFYKDWFESYIGKNYCNLFSIFE